MKTWKVTRPYKPPLEVRAHYMVLDHGHLCFRSHTKSYPDTVLIIAPGCWKEVTECLPE